VNALKLWNSAISKEAGLARRACVRLCCSGIRALALSFVLLQRPGYPVWGLDIMIWNWSAVSCFWPLALPPRKVWWVLGGCWLVPLFQAAVKPGIILLKKNAKGSDYDHMWACCVGFALSWNMDKNIHPVIVKDKVAKCTVTFTALLWKPFQSHFVWFHCGFVLKNTLAYLHALLCLLIPTVC